LLVFAITKVNFKYTIMTEPKKTAKLQKRSKKTSKPVAKKSWLKKPIAFFALCKGRIRELLSRRPHKSFHRTWRRDYVRSLKLPGYWAFTGYVRKIVWAKKKLFLGVVLVYALLTAALVGIASQDTYTNLSDTLRTTGQNVLQGEWNGVGEAGLLLATNITGAYNNTLSEVQQIYAIILGLFLWLTTVWLLRAILAGRKPKLRDGVYNAGAPVLPTFLVALVAIVQLLPVAFAAIAFGAGVESGILSGGIESMLFWTAALLLTVLSLYWITSTVIALVIVTLPGMYPMQALRTAGDLVIGRRIRILYRILWLLLLTALAWVVVVLPIIVFDTWLKAILPAISWLPLIPVTLLIMSTASIIWAASYVYLLYRKVVDDDAAPA